MENSAHIGSITPGPLDTALLPTSVKLADAMTITGIDSTGQSSGGTVVPPRQVTGAEDLDAELLALETEAETATQTAVIRGTNTPEGAQGGAGQGGKSRRGWLLRWVTWPDLVAIASFIAAALYLTASLWLHADHQLRDDPQDQAFFEWMLAHGTRVVTDGVNPFFSDRMNYPAGLNTMANTSVLAISLPMAPITILFGPVATFNLFLTLALAATGISWYFVLSRKLIRSNRSAPARLPAWVGALVCTLAPSMVSHAGGHPNIVSQFLVPLIIWRTLELRVPGKSLQNGLLLGALIVGQAFINLEILFMTAVGLGLFCLTVGVVRWRRLQSGEVKAFARGLVVAAALALTALAYPLFVQFLGPASYQGLPQAVRYFGADLGSFTAYSTRSVAGNTIVATRLAQNPAEQNAFFGWGLVILFAGMIAWMRRSLVIVTLGGIALLFAAFSLGPRIRYNGHSTNYPGVWALLHKLPVLDSVVPTRWALAIAPLVGIVLALGCQRAADLVKAQPAARGPVRVAMGTALAMALLPLAPVPLETKVMKPTPRFIAAGTWRQFVDDKHSVVVLPQPDGGFPDPLRWSAVTRQDMRISGAYALLPNLNPVRPDDHAALFEPESRPTNTMINAIRRGRPTPVLNDARRAVLLADLRFWKAGIVLLPPQDKSTEMKRVMTVLLGTPPLNTGGVWVWDVRHMVDDPSFVLTGPSVKQGTNS